MNYRKYQIVLKESFPLAFAFVFTLFYWILVTLYPILAIQMPSGTGFLVLISIVAVPFIIIGNKNPVIMLTGIILIALLSGVAQYAYEGRLLRSQKWQYLWMIIMAWIQTGFMLAISFLLILMVT
jgi:hypothetical protein